MARRIRGARWVWPWVILGTACGGSIGPEDGAPADAPFIASPSPAPGDDAVAPAELPAVVAPPPLEPPPEAAPPPTGDDPVLGLPAERIVFEASCEGSSAPGRLRLGEAAIDCGDDAGFAVPDFPPPEDGAARDVALVVCRGDACAPELVRLRWVAAPANPDGWALKLEAPGIDRLVPTVSCEASAGETYARDLRVAEVALYQGVKVTLAKDGASVPPNAPVIADRGGLLRVFVTPSPDYQARGLRAQLDVTGFAPLSQTRTIDAASEEIDGSSTFNFVLPAEMITEDLSLRVSVTETEACAPARGSGTAARWPAEGDAVPSVVRGRTLSLVVVPYRYQADGSDRLPALGPDQIDRFRSELFTMFPLSAVTVSVREAVDWPGTLSPDGGGWVDLLSHLFQLRQADGAAEEVFYYAAFAPAPTLRDFCDGSCTLGLGPVPSRIDTYRRAAMGVAYPGGQAANTLVHELAHALGRPHAPCGNPLGPDENYPYPSGSIGVPGYSLETGDLYLPTRYADVLSYCYPQWISDYTYGAIADRLSAIMPDFAPQALRVPRRWRSLLWSPGEAPRWGPAHTHSASVAGAPVEVHFRDATGQSLGLGTALEVPLDHEAGGMMMIDSAEIPAGTATVWIPTLGAIDYVP